MERTYATGLNELLTIADSIENVAAKIREAVELVQSDEPATKCSAGDDMDDAPRRVLSEAINELESVCHPPRVEWVADLLRGVFPSIVERYETDDVNPDEDSDDDR